MISRTAGLTSLELWTRAEDCLVIPLRTNLAAGVQENAALCFTAKVAAGEHFIEEGRVSTANTDTKISLGYV